jgi:hypothetical protein
MLRAIALIRDFVRSFDRGLVRRVLLWLLLVAWVLAIVKAWMKFGLSMPLIFWTLIVWLAGVFMYWLLTRPSEHCRDIAFTSWLAFIGVVSILVPTAIVHHADINPAALSDLPKCAENWWPPSSWFRQGTPCLAWTPFISQQEPLRLDRFLLWEAVAMVQTLVFGVTTFFDMKESKQFKKSTVSVLFCVVVAAAAALWCLVRQSWEGQLLGTVLFMTLVLTEDWLFWMTARRKSSVGTSSKPPPVDHEVEYLGKVAWGLDVPLVFANIILAAFVLPVNGAGHEYAKRFFAGGTAFSLILANTGLIAHRVTMHKHHYRSLRTTNTVGGFWHFIGLGEKRQPVNGSMGTP